MSHFGKDRQVSLALDNLQIKWHNRRVCGVFSFSVFFFIFFCLLNKSCKNSYVELILQVCFKNKQSCLKKLRNCLKLKNSKLGKNRKLNFRKTNNLRLMKFLVLICSEADYIHLKFQVAGTPSLADMVKKTNFGIFEAFSEYF